MEETNGHNSPSRLDRIEKVLEVVVTVIRDIQAEHQEFQKEHRQLLTAQVILTDRVDRLTADVDKLRDAQKDTDERLGALIRVVDDWIRLNPRPSI